MKIRHLAIFASILLRLVGAAYAAAPIDIGSRRELFVDDYLIDRQSGIDLRLHPPTPREIVLVYDSPWEGNGCTFRTIFRDGNVFRMWYTGGNFFNEDATKIGGHPIFYCYAESSDGIHWKKPELGICEFNGSKQNNIVWTAPDADNFMVFKDTNPDCRPGEKYKAVAQGKRHADGPTGLHAFKSPDGMHWTDLGEDLIISKGAFDTLNVAFWDNERGKYFCYVRDYSAREKANTFAGENYDPEKNKRIICVSTSNDFLHWTDPEPLIYEDSPSEQLYTNNVQPYYRAPQIFVGFPTRYVNRSWSQAFISLPDLEHRQRRMKFEPRFGTVVTDGLFMSSRDGRTFNRWNEPFFRAGIERKHNWLYGDCYVNCGIIETAAEDSSAPPELSFYVEENHSKTNAERTRRYTLRIDGFVSASAPRAGGEIITKPITFAGDQLSLNFTTTSVGGILVELQDADGAVIPGFSREECCEIFGDNLDRKVEWKSNGKVSDLAGKPIRLHFIMRDADLYAIQFK
jgi:hypothetical protein